VRVYSKGYSTEPQEFDLSSITPGESGHFLNYVKGVCHQMQKMGHTIGGVDLYIESTVPSSGGVSSSAALELSLVTGLCALFDIHISPLQMAVLSQKAENGEIVRVPCGFLDQASSALSKKDHLLFLDFLPEDGVPVSKTEQIPFKPDYHQTTFVVIVDKSVKRNLGASGYPARRALCEQSLPILTTLLGKPVSSLRDVSMQEFERCRKELESKNPLMSKRVEHIVYENHRVLDAIEALKMNDIVRFGRILTASGKSALELYDLDEQTPELTNLVTKGREIEGVMGMRNMGGGFSSIALALVQKKDLVQFQKQLDDQYGTPLEYIPFEPSDGASVIE
jgi:galactokinase